MGVDYKANYGIGVKLKPIKNEEYIETIHSLVKTTNFEFIETGDGSYSGDFNDFFICIKKPFENGINGLSEKFLKLSKFLNDNGIEYDGSIDVIGGLHIS